MFQSRARVLVSFTPLMPRSFWTNVCDSYRNSTIRYTIQCINYYDICDKEPDLPTLASTAAAYSFLLVLVDAVATFIEFARN